eukprot:6492142-Amphidinium_carterae.2
MRLTRTHSGTAVIAVSDTHFGQWYACSCFPACVLSNAMCAVSSTPIPSKLLAVIPTSSPSVINTSESLAKAGCNTAGVLRAASPASDRPTVAQAPPPVSDASLATTIGDTRALKFNCSSGR